MCAPAHIIVFQEGPGKKMKYGFSENLDKQKEIINKKITNVFYPICNIPIRGGGWGRLDFSPMSA